MAKPKAKSKAKSKAQPKPTPKAKGKNATTKGAAPRKAAAESSSDDDDDEREDNPAPRATGRTAAQNHTNRACAQLLLDNPYRLPTLDRRPDGHELALEGYSHHDWIQLRPSTRAVYRCQLRKLITCDLPLTALGALKWFYLQLRNATPMQLIRRVGPGTLNTMRSAVRFVAQVTMTPPCAVSYAALGSAIRTLAAIRNTAILEGRIPPKLDKGAMTADMLYGGFTATAKAQGMSPRLLDTYYLAHGLGLRYSEVAYIKPCEFSRDPDHNNEWRHTGPRYKTQRSGPITIVERVPSADPRFVAVLERLLAEARATQRGTLLDLSRWTYQEAAKEFSRVTATLLERGSLTKGLLWTTHVLRNGAALEAYNIRNSLEDVKRRTGHSANEMAEMYARSNPLRAATRAALMGNIDPEADEGAILAGLDSEPVDWDALDRQYENDPCLREAKERLSRRPVGELPTPAAHMFEDSDDPDEETEAHTALGQQMRALFPNIDRWEQELDRNIAIEAKTRVPRMGDHSSAATSDTAATAAPRLIAPAPAPAPGLDLGLPPGSQVVSYIIVARLPDGSYSEFRRQPVAGPPSRPAMSALPLLGNAPRRERDIV